MNSITKLIHLNVLTLPVEVAMQLALPIEVVMQLVLPIEVAMQLTLILLPSTTVSSMEDKTSTWKAVNSEEMDSPLDPTIELLLEEPRFMEPLLLRKNPTVLNPHLLQVPLVLSLSTRQVKGKDLLM